MFRLVRLIEFEFSNLHCEPPKPEQPPILHCSPQFLSMSELCAETLLVLLVFPQTSHIRKGRMVQ